jgi:hypothetical protein
MTDPTSFNNYNSSDTELVSLFIQNYSLGRLTPYRAKHPKSVCSITFFKRPKYVHSGKLREQKKKKENIPHDDMFFPQNVVHDQLSTFDSYDS